jgi:hypothetical protein
MHEISVWFSSWSATLYVWARTAVGIVLWFWVISGAIFLLRFLAFVLLDKHAGSPPLTATPTLVPFQMDGFNTSSGTESTKDIR